MSPLGRRRFVALLLPLAAAAVLGCCLIASLRSEPRMRRAPGYKYILQWNSYFGYANLGQGPVSGNIFERLNCPRSRCVFTEDASLMAPEEFDAVVFHMYALRLYGLPVLNWGKLPPSRSPHQRYIFFLMEAPPMAGSSFARMEGLFNWTMTYRLDSDIVRPYAEIVPLGGAPAPSQGWLRAPAPPAAPSAALDAPDAEGEGGAVVAWLVSHCRTQSRREEYVRALQEHIPVDVYGYCGSMPGPQDDLHGFYRMLSSKYKFYLAFENSLCRDYVTEKLFNILPLDVVPVVYGAANYSAIAPPHSYIDTRDFASPKHLAQYLHFLARRPEELAKFWWWKRHYRVVSNPPSTLCRLCERLHNPGPPRVYADIARWWAGPGKCEEPRLFD